MQSNEEVLVIGFEALADVTGGKIDMERALASGTGWAGVGGAAGTSVGVVAGGIAGGIAGSAAGGVGAVPGALGGIQAGGFIGSFAGTALGFGFGVAKDLWDQTHGTGGAPAAGSR